MYLAGRIEGKFLGSMFPDAGFHLTSNVLFYQALRKTPQERYYIQILDEETKVHMSSNGVRRMEGTSKTDE